MRYRKCRRKRIGELNEVARKFKLQKRSTLKKMDTITGSTAQALVDLVPVPVRARNLTTVKAAVMKSCYLLTTTFIRTHEAISVYIVL